VAVVDVVVVEAVLEQGPQKLFDSVKAVNL